MRILFVDTNVEIPSSVALLFERLSYDECSALDLRVKRISRDEFQSSIWEAHAVVLEPGLGEQSLDFAKDIRKKYPSIPVFIVIADELDSEELRHDAKMSGVRGVILQSIPAADFCSIFIELNKDFKKAG